MNIRDKINKQIETASKSKIDAKNITAKKVTATAAKQAEVAANEEDFVWYIYSSSVGMKFNSDPGNAELTLTEGSSFGLRPTEGDDNTVDLISEDTGTNVIFRIPSDIVETIIDRSSEDEGSDEEEESEEDTSEDNTVGEE